MRALLKQADLTIELDGRAVPVNLRRNAQARKMILRVDALTGAIKLTAPKHVSLRELSRFLNESRDWIAAERAKVQALPILGDGGLLPYEGNNLRITYTGIPPRRVTLADDAILVGGPFDQAPARLERWLKAEARSALMCDVEKFTAALGIEYSRVSIGDMKSRWGSCSSSGTLRFNWRLIMAPTEIRRYVAAHEVCHLLEMNHSPAFWAHVQSVEPDYKPHRKWLRDHGSDLMRVRFRNPQTDG